MSSCPSRCKHALLLCLCAGCLCASRSAARCCLSRPIPRVVGRLTNGRPSWALVAPLHYSCTPALACAAAAAIANAANAALAAAASATATAAAALGAITHAAAVSMALGREVAGRVQWSGVRV